MYNKQFHMTRPLLNYLQILYKTRKVIPHIISHNSGFYSTFILETLANDVEGYKNKMQRNDSFDISLQHCRSKCSKNNVSQMSAFELDNAFSDLLSKSKDKQIVIMIEECQIYGKCISNKILKDLYENYSNNGKPNMISVLQNYCANTNIDSYLRNGEFSHYLAKAQCMKGNSEIGLSILKTNYSKYDSLRSLYRRLFKELIQDSILNRSEASLRIFQKYVLLFSEECLENYPLMCFWYISWSSTWFSDQMLSNELLECSEILRNIVREKATTFSIMVLKNYNEDAVLRLLQTLLKYKMMSEYVAVLQVLFNHKLKIRDIRGCTEIVKNCEALNLTLSSQQQGRYIKMVIKGEELGKEDDNVWKKRVFDFKLKF